jgi:DNA helicase-2/ATP-dependent DNA helicase PcrA
VDLLENLNKEQLSAVTHTTGPLLIVAGAGTGKTTVITRRIGYLIQQGFARPDQILALTFTEKAAGEMVDRTENLLPLGTLDLWISTFHSFAERILKQHALDIGISNDFKLLDDIGQWILVHRNFDKFKLKYYRPLGNPNKFIDALLSHFSKCKDEMITPEDYLAYAEQLKLNGDSAEGVRIQNEQADSEEIERIEELASAYHVYQKLLLDNNYLDFGDLIHYVTVLLKQRPKILQYYQNHFKYILVDEFQDTNYAQYELIKMLAGNKERNLTVVGDDDQSIYKFRGASVSNILKLKTDFPDFKQIALIQNYRSAQNILDLAYDFIQANNPSRLEVELGINKRLVTDAKPPGTIQVLEAADLSGELDLVIKKINELKTNDPELSWNDFCILIRSNSSSGELLPKLEIAGIPFYYFANQGLFKKRLIFDLINYLKLLDNYHESLSLFRVMEFPKFALHPEDIAMIKSFIDRKTLSLYEALSNTEMRAKISEDARAKLDELAASLHKHGEEGEEKTAVEVFVSVVKDLGIDVWLAPETLEHAQQREFLEQFYKKIEAYEQENEDKSLAGFLHVLSLEQEAGSEGTIKFDPNMGPELVKVMTIHASKGLEFQYVFIINMVDQRFPTRGKRDAIEIPEALIKDILPEGDFHLQEERRLFYVALTRAKKGVFLSWAKDYGGSREKKPSIFLQETKLISIP